MKRQYINSGVAAQTSSGRTPAGEGNRGERVEIPGESRDEHDGEDGHA